jgi:hypothetical protein
MLVIRQKTRGSAGATHREPRNPINPGEATDE